MSDADSSVSRQRTLEALKRHAGDLLLRALEDPLTIEVMLNADGRLWQERLGEPMRSIGWMESYKAEAMFRVIAASLNKVVTSECPQLDGELPLDGSRFSGALPPVVSAPVFAIRKKASRVFSLDDYLASGTISLQQYEVLCQAVSERKNILIIGGTSSGKTTLVNALIDQMVGHAPEQRIFILEDTCEIQCRASNTVAMHTSLNVTMTDLLKQVLRLRPDRICVGEVRDHAALDLLDAWNTGHEGGIATVHANSAFEGLTRIRRLVSRSPFHPEDIEEDIAQAVHRIVFIHKTPHGRRVREIMAVNGYDRSAKRYDVDYLAKEEKL